MTTNAPHNPLRITSHRGEFFVHFVGQVLSVLREEIRERDVIILDKNVADLYPELADFARTHQTHLVTPSEEAKTYQALVPLIESLIAGGFTKTDRLIAIGGGIVQDITAFTASILFRGVPWLFFPTNLLAQCDSCIGSKTSINFGPYKNQLGGFYPPERIYLCTEMLKTLPERDFRSGIGEMLHYFCVSGREDVNWAKNRVFEVLKSRKGVEELIFRSLSIKKDMIERDEFDQGPRNVFNYGHSFGHALETATDFAIPHGIAVSFGMDLANTLSVHLGLIEESLQKELRELYAMVWEGFSLKNVNVDRFLSALKRDKKNEGTQIKVILTKGLGQMFKTTLHMDEEVMSIMKSFIASH